jgi:nitroreductase/Pyruvate/2-oxoacid:ferredoxin oxidoreductase delta subunit
MFTVNKKKCVGCGKCVRDCFTNDIEMADKKAHIKNEACIKCGHCIAICPEDAVSTDEYEMKELIDYSKKNFEIDDDNLLNFMKFRRSIRRFKDKDVSTKKISKVIEAGRFSPTASNLQKVSYIVVKEGIRELTSLALESLKKKGELILGDEQQQDPVMKRYAASWIKMHEQFQSDPKKGDRIFFNAPAVIVVTANSDIDGALASSRMELMANALGLGNLFSGFFVRASRDNKEILDFLEVKEGQHVVTCMVIGYPDVDYKRTVPRKSADITWK